MNKKIFSRLLMGAVAAVTLSTTFVSCKDYDEDLYSDLQSEILSRNASLKTYYDGKLVAVNARIDSLNAVVAAINSCECDSALLLRTALENFKAYLNTDGDKKYAALSAYMTWDEFYEALYGTSGAGGHGATDLMQALKDYINSLIQLDNSRDTLLMDAVDSLKARVLALEKDSMASVVERLVKLEQFQIEANEHFKQLDSLTEEAKKRADAAFTLAEKAMTQAGINADSLKILDVKIENNSFRIDTLSSVVNVMGDQITELYRKAAEAEAKIEAIEARMDAFEDKLANLDDSLKNLYTITQNNLDAVKIYVDSKIATIEAQMATKSDLEALETKVGDLQDAFNQYTQYVDNELSDLWYYVSLNSLNIYFLDQSLQEVIGDIETINDRLNKQVTSVIVEAIYNNLYGYVNLPVGLESRVIGGFYGKANSALEFPTSDGGQKLTAADLIAIGAIKGDTVIAAGSPLLTGEGAVKAGKVYLTINPAETDFEGKTFTVVNSQGEETGVQLRAVKKSDYLLTFGIRPTRADEAGNGFYEAEAVIPQNQLYKTALYINDDMKAAVKENISLLRKSLKERSFNFDLKSLASATYNQINDLFGEALAVKTQWEDAAGTHSVMSGYDMAARTIHPLSYDFAKNANMPSIPTINPLADIKVSDLINFKGVNVNLDDLTFNKINFNDLDSIEVEISVTVPVPDTDNVTITATVTDNGSTGEGTGHLEDFDATTGTGNVVVDNVTLEINVSANIETVNIPTRDSLFTTTVKVPLDLVNARIRDLVDGVNGNVESMIEQIKSKMKGINESLDLSSADAKIKQYVDQVNNIITRVNLYIRKINRYIKNANHFLQPMMAYHTADGAMHQLSHSKALPSPFKVTGAEAGTILTATSYSAELVAPAFKKFVAVTNVWPTYPTVATTSAQQGDAKCKEAMALANGKEFMAEVLPGTQHQVVFTTGEAYDGYVYEIAYQAVDFSGVVRTSKYYVRVTK